MAATHLFTCTCGTQKKTTNHWILALVEPGSIRFIPWDSALAMRDDVIVLCGERCAAKLLSHSLGDWKQTSVAVAQQVEEIARAVA
ncbi:MAG TPA: hypothetical protein VN612_04105 [Acidobacteriaceae bacterium]|nr:hypothetical protein [Acidobacteriaceae bacterium]